MTERHYVIPVSAATLRTLAETATLLGQTQEEIVCAALWHWSLLGEELQRGLLDDYLTNGHEPPTPS